jgi:hypothetical protein
VFSCNPDKTLIAEAAIEKVQDKIARGFWKPRVNGKPRNIFHASDVQEA